MHPIDLRSDTVTLPTNEMLEAISKAELGDDVFQEDPTVNKLEHLAAKTFNKESAIFMPSGTMANLVAVLTHCQRGDEVILGDQSHTFLYEAGGISSFGGVHSRQIKNYDVILIIDIMHHIKKNLQEKLIQKTLSNMKKDSILIFKDISNRNIFFSLCSSIKFDIPS